MAVLRAQVNVFDRAHRRDDALPLRASGRFE